jgi:transcriptional regulator with XRE-family HTH domain
LSNVSKVAPKRPDSPGQNSELAGFVKTRRHRLTRDVRSSERFRGRQGNVTQEELAEVIGVSVVWYSNLERGVRANYSDAFLHAAAAALRLGVDERVLLYMLAVGRTPPLLPGLDLTVVPDSVLDQFVRGQCWPTYVLDRYLRVVLHNQLCESYYPWLREDSSYPRWMLTSADARARLVNWEADWAAPLLAQLRLARARYPQDIYLAGLVDECLRTSADTRRLWDADHEPLPRSRRGIMLAGDRQPTTVDVVTFTNWNPTELQVVVLLPAAESAL